MIVAGVMVGVLLIGAWLGLMAAAVLELVEHDVVATSSAILLAVASNLLLVFILFGMIRRKSRYLHTVYSEGGCDRWDNCEDTQLIFHHKV